MMACTFNPGIPEPEAGGSLLSLRIAVQHREFQASQEYIVRHCLKGGRRERREGGREGGGEREGEGGKDEGKKKGPQNKSK